MHHSLARHDDGELERLDKLGLGAVARDRLEQRYGADQILLLAQVQLLFQLPRQVLEQHSVLVGLLGRVAIVPQVLVVVSDRVLELERCVVSRSGNR